MTKNNQANNTFRTSFLKFCLLNAALFAGYMGKSFSMEKEPSESTLDLSNRFLQGANYDQKVYFALTPIIKASQAKQFLFDGNLNIQAPDHIFEGDPIPEDLETYEKEIDGEIFTFVKEPFVETINSFIGNQSFQKASFRNSLDDSKINILFKSWLNVTPSNLSNLLVLDLSHNKLDFRFVGENCLISVFENAKNLKTLNLSHIPFGKQIGKDSSVFGKYLRDGLAKAPALEHLNLSNTQMTGDLLSFICGGISANKKIRYLDLSENPLLDIADSIGRFGFTKPLNHSLSIIFKNNRIYPQALDLFGELLIPEIEDEINWTITSLDYVPASDARNSVYVDFSCPSLPKEDIEEFKSKVSQWYNIEFDEQKGKLIVRGKSLDENFVPQNPFEPAGQLASQEAELKKRQALMDAMETISKRILATLSSPPETLTPDIYEKLALEAHSKGLDETLKSVILQWIRNIESLKDLAPIGAIAQRCDCQNILAEKIDINFPYIDKLSPNYLSKTLQRAMAFAISGIKPQAVEALEKLVQNKEQFDIGTLGQIANIYSMAGNLEKQEDLLKYAQSKAKTLNDYLIIAGRYGQGQSLGHAQECLEKAYNICKENPEFLSVANSYAQFGFKKQATQILNELKVKAKNPLDYNGIALCYYNKLDMEDEALKYLLDRRQFLRSITHLSSLAQGFHDIGASEQAQETMNMALGKAIEIADYILVAHQALMIGFNDIGNRALSVIEQVADTKTLLGVAYKINEVARQRGISDQDPMIVSLKKLLNQAIQKATSAQDLALVDNVLNQLDINKSEFLENISDKRKAFVQERRQTQTQSWA